MRLIDFNHHCAELIKTNTALRALRAKHPAIFKRYDALNEERARVTAIVKEEARDFVDDRKGTVVVRQDDDLFISVTFRKPTVSYDTVAAAQVLTDREFAKVTGPTIIPEAFEAMIERLSDFKVTAIRTEEPSTPAVTVRMP